jgi:hypothetical protein
MGLSQKHQQETWQRLTQRLLELRSSSNSSKEEQRRRQHSNQGYTSSSMVTPKTLHPLATASVRSTNSSSAWETGELPPSAGSKFRFTMSHQFYSSQAQFSQFVSPPPLRSSGWC